MCLFQTDRHSFVKGVTPYSGQVGVFESTVGCFNSKLLD